MEIDLKNYPDLKEELDSLDEDEVLYVKEDGEEKYVLIPSRIFDEAENLYETINSQPQTVVKVISADGSVNPDLTYDEYERIKKQLIKTLDETFKPKPDKLN